MRAVEGGMLVWMELVRWVEVGIRVDEMVTEKSHVWGYGINEGEMVGSELSDNGWWRGGRRQCLCDDSCGGEG